jgi:hypothetical protein
VSAGPSYQAVWLFAIFGLCAVGVYWVAVTTSKDMETSAIASPTPALNAAVQLVQHCGKPGRDSISPAKLQPKAPERWSLFYKSARVKAVFERDTPQNTDGWKNVKYFDPASGKQLNSQQVLKRLPCAVSTTPSP